MQLKLSDFSRYRLHRVDSDRLSDPLSDDDLWRICSGEQMRTIKLLARAHGQLPPPPTYAPPPVPNEPASTSGLLRADLISTSNMRRGQDPRPRINGRNEPSSNSPRTSSENQRVSNSPYTY
jgi:hypothetical protein